MCIGVLIVGAAAAFYEKQKSETGREFVFVISDGQGKGEVNSDSLTMKNYLVEKGIREERMIEKDKTACTLENIRFSKVKVKELSTIDIFSSIITFFTALFSDSEDIPAVPIPVLEAVHELLR